jgi:hypothetical protein
MWGDKMTGKLLQKGLTIIEEPDEKHRGSQPELKKDLSGAKSN